MQDNTVGNRSPSVAEGYKRAPVHPNGITSARDDWDMIAMIDNGAVYHNSSGALEDIEGNLA